MPRPARAAATLLAAALAASALAGELHELDRHECLHARVGWEAGARAAESAAPWDAATGRDTRNYARSRRADYERMTLEIDIPDMNDPRFTAHQTLTFTPVGKPLDALTMDAEGMTIDAVTMNERAVDFSHDGHTLTIRFDPPVAPGQQATIVTKYAVQNPTDGMIWTVEHPSAPDRAAQLHTQGQPETNRHWFPAHDSPNERLATEVIVTVPDGFLASSNGRLESESAANGRRTFHWVQEKPHAAYLVSLVVGKFDVVDVAAPGSSLPLPCYVAPGDADKVERTFGRTRDMMQVFEERFAEPYPWDRYAQLLVWNFGAGGMENTSATTLYEWCILDEHAEQDGDQDGLIAHELGHQWFGDYLTCKTWAHLWLNEGFATYSESLWFEKRDGYDAGYLDDIWSNMRGVAGRDRLDAKDADAWKRPGMVSNVWDDPGENFSRRSNPYPKGASILHMLRVKLGDELFFDGLEAYVDRHALSEVETDDFRKALESVSGLALEQFFHQWAIRPGTPEVTMTAKWSEKDKALNITIDQTQRIDENTPAFVFELPIHIEIPSGAQTVTIDVAEKRHERSIPLDAEPMFVALDAGLAVLMTPTYKAPAGWLRAQAANGPTVPSRLDAVRALREHAGADTTATLAAVVRDSGEHHHVRRLAADELRRMRRSAELIDILNSGVADARVRRAVVSSIASAGDRGAALPIMLRIARDEGESYAVRAAAIESLGTLGDESHVPMLIAALNIPSQGDQIQRAALAALRQLDHKDALEPVLAICTPALSSRVQFSAFSTAAELSHHDPERAYEVVEPLLWSPIERTRNAAGSALSRIKDKRGVTSLRQAAEAHPIKSFRDSCKTWADRLDGLVKAEDLETVQKELGKVQRELDDLKTKIEKMEADEKNG